jgi:hypothetical protein
VLRTWGEDAKLTGIDGGLATGKAEGQRRWYVNRQGQTLVVFPAPGEVVVGKGREQYKARIDGSFAIAAREVTVGQFLKFRKDHEYDKQEAPSEECPVNNLSWYDAAAYCNWLSEQEGIRKDQWCYLPNKGGKYAAGMRMAPGWRGWTGYRLPSDAEWEHACRAGSITYWSCGRAGELLEKYYMFATRDHPRHAQDRALIKQDQIVYSLGAWACGVGVLLGMAGCVINALTKRVLFLGVSLFGITASGFIGLIALLLYGVTDLPPT